jgi:hypothetical protein
MISVINGLVIRFVLICSNVCVVPLLWALNRAGIRGFERNRATIYHSMGVLGAEIANYDRNGKSKILFCVSLFMMLNVAYFIQTCTFYIWMRLVFPSTFPAAVSDMYFAYLNLMELAWLIFGRTRLTLKYYPKLTTLYNLLFLVYFNSYSYAASAQLLMTIICLDVATVLWFLKNCELPGMKTWNPFDLNTPSPQRPRIGHHTVLNDTNYGTGMYFWTAMMPLRAREYFTRRERELGDTLAEYPRYFLQYNPRPQGNDQPPMQERPDLGEAPAPA